MKSALVVLFCVLGVCLLSAAPAQASCNAQVICQVTVISCNGQSTCNSGSNWVQCDSQSTIYCPVCQAQTTCCDNRFIYCNGYSSCEESPGNWVKCDGQIRGICPDCPNWWGQEVAPAWARDTAADQSCG